MPFSEPPSRGKSLIFSGLLWMALGGVVMAIGNLVLPSVGFHVLYLGVPFIFGASVFLGGIWSAAKGV